MGATLRYMFYAKKRAKIRRKNVTETRVANVALGTGVKNVEGASSNSEHARFQDFSATKTKISSQRVLDKSPEKGNCNNDSEIMMEI